MQYLVTNFAKNLYICSYNNTLKFKKNKEICIKAYSSISKRKLFKVLKCTLKSLRFEMLESKNTCYSYNKCQLFYIMYGSVLQEQMNIKCH